MEQYLIVEMKQISFPIMALARVALLEALLTLQLINVRILVNCVELRYLGELLELLKDIQLFLTVII